MLKPITRKDIDDVRNLIMYSKFKNILVPSQMLYMYYFNISDSYAIQDTNQVEVYKSLQSSGYMKNTEENINDLQLICMRNDLLRIIIVYKKDVAHKEEAVLTDPCISINNTIYIDFGYFWTHLYSYIDTDMVKKCFEKVLSTVKLDKVIDINFYIDILSLFLVENRRLEEKMHYYIPNSADDIAYNTFINKLGKIYSLQSFIYLKTK
jgi:hypothetical protein